MNNIIGTCSICGGPVVAPDNRWTTAIDNSGPKCKQCGAVLADYGPVLKMKPSAGYEKQTGNDLSVFNTCEKEAEKPSGEVKP